MREWLKVGFILTLVFSGYIFADVKMSEKYPNVPASWEEECIPQDCKDDTQKICRHTHCYKIRKKFTDGLTTQDPNVWVVTPKFGKTFGMPDESISEELQGVEAIAYRQQFMYKECGFGSIGDQCNDNYQGIMDVYIDEKKTPLPWINPYSMADLHRIGNSTFHLASNSENGGFTETYKRPQVGDNDPEKLKGKYGLIHNVHNDWYKLRPFADPLTKHEAAYFQSGAGGWQEIISGIYGYKRDAIEGLTVISFFFRLWGEGENIGKTIALISDFEGVWRPKNGKIHHQFYIPGSFGNKIRIVDEARKKKDREFFQETLKKMGYEIKVKEPAKDTNDTGFFQKIFK